MVTIEVRDLNDGEDELDQSRLSSIKEMIQNIPLEEFVSNEDVKSSASIVQLRNSLRNRGKTSDYVSTIGETRSELVEEVLKCRNYSDTCCICAQEYEEFDQLRVLPNCKHEFHAECFDRWATTFASSSLDRFHAPTCPLCKVPLTINLEGQKLTKTQSN